MSASTVDIANVLGALKIIASYDAKGAIEAIEAGTFRSKVIDGLIAVDDVAKIVGLFFPLAAVVANDLGIAIQIEQLAYPIAEWIAKQPGPNMVGKISVWGAVVDDKGLFQE